MPEEGKFFQRKFCHSNFLDYGAPQGVFDLSEIKSALKKLIMIIADNEILDAKLKLKNVFRLNEESFFM